MPRATSTCSSAGHSSSATLHGSSRNARWSARATSRKWPDVLVAEMTATREHPRRSRLRHRVHDEVVALRSARLDDRAHAPFEREGRPVGEREERVRGEHGAVGVVPELGGLVERYANGVHPAHLAGADADRGEIRGDDDRVRQDVLAHAPREDEIAPLLLVRRACDDGPAVAVLDLAICVLHQNAAEHALEPALLRTGPPALAVDEDARALP